MITRLLIGLAVLSLLFGPSLLTTNGTRAAGFEFEAQMYGDQQVPPVSTVGWGFFRFFFNDDRSAAEVTVDIKGLAGDAVISADIHRGAPGSNGPVIKHVADGGFIVTAAHVTFTRAELQEMAAGNLYISLKTVTHPDGELRGQIVPPAGFLPPPPAPTEVPTEVPQNPGGVFIRPPDTGDAGLAGQP